MKYLKVIRLWNATRSWRLLLLVFLYLAAPDAIVAQRYADMRKEGIELMNKRNYKDAINVFWSALVVCKDKPDDHDLDKLRMEAQNRWEEELKIAVASAQNSYRDALAAKEVAMTAKNAEEKARRQAEDNAIKAREQGIKAESLRLALLANMARQQGRKSDALFLSWMALQLSGPELPPFVMNAFGDAVRDSFAVRFFSSPYTVESMAFFPSGQKILLKTADQSWHIVGVGPTPSVTHLSANMTNVAAANGRSDLMLAWGSDNTVQVLNATGIILAILTGHTEPVRSAVFSPDDSHILTCSRDNTARLWDLKGNQLAVLEGHTANVQSGHFSADGSFLLTRSADGTARIWTAQGALLGTLGGTDEYLHESLIDPVGSHILTLSSDGNAKLYQKDGVLLRTLDLGGQPVKGAAYAPALAKMAVRVGLRTVGLLDGDGKLLATYPHTSTVSGMSLNRDGSLLATWADDQVVRLWNDKGQLLHELGGHRGKITAASFSSEEGHILTTCQDGTAKLWDSDGNVLTEWDLGIAEPTPALFPPAGQYFIATDNNGKSVSSVPFPMVIYRSVEPETVLHAANTPKLLREYDIQYVEELMNKKQ